MHDFVRALLGGLVMGVASAALFVCNGRILGISGVLGGALKSASRDASWRWAFIAGMLGAGATVFALMPAAFQVPSGRSLGVCVAAGMLVGGGTQLGSGCTSGHGICGIGRGSTRSLSATMVFMATGALSVIAVRYLFGGEL